MKNILLQLLGLLLVCALIYGSYWLVKHGYYWLWYEDMVIQTIQETVKAEALK